MRWITRHEPHVDRCASIWLIKTMINPEAVFDFVSRDVPVPKGAIPLVLPGAELGPTERATTFDALMGKYYVEDPIVARIEDIIRDLLPSLMPICCSRSQGVMTCLCRIRSLILGANSARVLMTAS